MMSDKSACKGTKKKRKKKMYAPYFLLSKGWLPTNVLHRPTKLRPTLPANKVISSPPEALDYTTPNASSNGVSTSCRLLRMTLMSRALMSSFVSYPFL